MEFRTVTEGAQLIGTILAGIFVAWQAIKALKAANKAQVSADKAETAQTTGKADAQEVAKQTAEDWLAEFGTAEILDLKKRNRRADHRYRLLREKFEAFEAAASKKAAEDQGEISDLKLAHQALESTVELLKIENENIRGERDKALKTVERQNEVIDGLKAEQKRDRDSIHQLELKVTELQARDTLMQDLKSLFVETIKPQTDKLNPAKVPHADPALSAGDEAAD